MRGVRQKTLGNNGVGIKGEEYLLIRGILDFIGCSMVFEGLKVAG